MKVARPLHLNIRKQKENHKRQITVKNMEEKHKLNVKLQTKPPNNEF